MITQLLKIIGAKWNPHSLTKELYLTMLEDLIIYVKKD